MGADSPDSRGPGRNAPGSTPFRTSPARPREDKEEPGRSAEVSRPSPAAPRAETMSRRFQLYLPDSVLVRLDMESRVTGRSRADIIREALEKHFAEGAGGPPRALQAIIGLARRPGDSDGSDSTPES